MFALVVDGIIIACADNRRPILILACALERLGFNFRIQSALSTHGAPGRGNATTPAPSPMMMDGPKGYCDTCQNTGYIDCLCGGDLCVCGQEEIECPVCGGVGGDDDDPDQDDIRD
jgi:hypothetical protein